MSAPAASSASPAAAAPSVDDEIAAAVAANDMAALDQEQYEAQRDMIAAEVASQALIGDLEPLSSLEAEYATNPKFLRKIQAAASGPYPEFRRVRGDGNCFYRSYVFGCLEWLSNTLRNDSASDEDKAKAQQLIATVENSLSLLVSAGYDTTFLEDFFAEFNDQFQFVATSKPSADQLLERFRDEGLAQYIVSYARYLTSAYLGIHASEYAPFIPDGRTVDEFRKSEIEPLNRESEHLELVCLTRLMGVGLRVAYLDQSEGGGGGNGDAADASMRTYDFPEGATPRVHLLYRPGHYDVLHVKQ